jgi:hypothetical protein
MTLIPRRCRTVLAREPVHNHRTLARVPCRERPRAQPESVGPDSSRTTPMLPAKASIAAEVTLRVPSSPGFVSFRARVPGLGSCVAGAFGRSPVRLQPWAAEVPHRADLGRDTQPPADSISSVCFPPVLTARRSWLVEAASLKVVLEDIGAVNQDSLSCARLRSPLAWSPGRPLLDRFLSPQLGSSDVRVGLGHLVAGDVRADRDFCDAEELGNLFCRPPVSTQRTGGLSHAADGTAMRCPRSRCFAS